MNDSALIHPALMVTAQIYDHAARGSLDGASGVTL
jgi:hypothetical protein